MMTKICSIASWMRCLCLCWHLRLLRPLGLQKPIPQLKAHKKIGPRDLDVVFGFSVLPSRSISSGEGGRTLDLLVGSPSSCRQDERFTPDVYAATLASARKKAHFGGVVQRLAAYVKHSSKTVTSHLRSAAQLCIDTQTSNLQKFVEHLWRLQQSDKVKVIAYVDRVTYDETPLKSVISWGGQRIGPEVAKNFVFQSSWALLVRHEKIGYDASQDDMAENSERVAAYDYVIYRGWMSPQMRATDSAKGEAVAAMLRSCPEPPKLINDPSFCENRIRLVETDSAPSNSRGERLWNRYRPGWQQCEVPCSAHRIHSAAERTFQMTLPWLRGATRTLLVSLQAYYMAAIRRAFEDLVRERCVVIKKEDFSLSREARIYRRNIIETFIPDMKSSRKRSRALLLFCCVFNGDWRQDSVIQHICSGEACCANGRESTV